MAPNFVVLWFCLIPKPIQDVCLYLSRQPYIYQCTSQQYIPWTALVSHFEIFVSILRKESVSLGDCLSSSLPSLYIFDIYLDKSKFQNIYENIFFSLMGSFYAVESVFASHLIRCLSLCLLDTRYCKYTQSLCPQKYAFFHLCNHL
jgi:hypothetical protein